MTKKSSFSFSKWYLSKSVTHTVYHLKNSIRACAIYTRPLNQLVVIELLSYKGAVVHRSKGRLSQTFEWLLLVSSAAFMPQCTTTSSYKEHLLLLLLASLLVDIPEDNVAYPIFQKISEKRNAPYFKIQTVLTRKVVCAADAIGPQNMITCIGKTLKKKDALYSVLSNFMVLLDF